MITLKQALSLSQDELETLKTKLTLRLELQI